jgi:hypothetical protein
MRFLISLVLLLAVVGIALADVGPQRRLGRPLVNAQQYFLEDQPGVLGYVARVVLRFFAPSFGRTDLRYSVRGPVIPPPCGLACRIRPLEAVAQ